VGMFLCGYNINPAVTGEFAEAVYLCIVFGHAALGSHEVAPSLL